MSLLDRFLCWLGIHGKREMVGTATVEYLFGLSHADDVPVFQCAICGGIWT